MVLDFAFGCYSQVQFGFSDLQRTNLELDSYKEKIKENQEKIKLNKQLPFFGWKHC